jgi:prolyl-tRNA synthetase
MVAAAIEQNHDARGIIWPLAIAPFELALAPINMHRSARLRERVERLYDDLQAAGIEVLLYDRAERPGVMFTDLELIGIPYRLVMSERGLDSEIVELHDRRRMQTEELPAERAVADLKERLFDVPNLADC